MELIAGKTRRVGHFSQLTLIVGTRLNFFKAFLKFKITTIHCCRALKLGIQARLHWLLTRELNISKWFYTTVVVDSTLTSIRITREDIKVQPMFRKGLVLVCRNLKICCIQDFNNRIQPLVIRIILKYHLMERILSWKFNKPWLLPLHSWT